MQSKNRAKDAYAMLENASRELARLGEYELIVLHLSKSLEREVFPRLETAKHRRKLRKIIKEISQLIRYFSASLENETEIMKVAEEVADAKRRGKGISEALFEEIGEKLGISTSSARKLHYDNVREHGLKNSGPSKRKPKEDKK